MSLRYLSMLISMYRKVFWVPLLKARMINTWPWMYRSQSSRTVCFPSEPGLNLRMIPNNILELPSKIKSIWQSSLVLMGMFTYLSIGWVILILHVYTYIHVCIHTHIYKYSERKRKIYFKKIGSCYYKGFQIWNLWGRLAAGDPGESWCCSFKSSLKMEFLFPQVSSVFSLNACNWLDDVNSHFVGWSDLFKVY